MSCKNENNLMNWHFEGAVCRLLLRLHHEVCAHIGYPDMVRISTEQAERVVEEAQSEGRGVRVAFDQPAPFCRLMYAHSGWCVINQGLGPLTRQRGHIYRSAASGSSSGRIRCLFTQELSSTSSRLNLAYLDSL